MPPVKKKPPATPEPPRAERYFPTVMRYGGLVIAMYEGLIERPPEPLVIGFAALMMAGARVLERVVDRKYTG